MIMHKQIDLGALSRVAAAGDPKDNVVVSRRWLAQVAHEMHTLRLEKQDPALDYSPHFKVNDDSSVTIRSIETGSLYAPRPDRVASTVRALGA